MGAIGWFLQIVVAWVFLLTAAWKMLNPVEARRAVRGYVPRLSPDLAGPAVWCVVALELLAGIGLLGGGAFRFPATVLGAMLLITFSVAALSRPEPHQGTGCGCWRAASRQETGTGILWRNLLLLVLLVGGALGAPPPTVWEAVLLAIPAAVVAWIVLDAPVLMSVLRSPTYEKERT